MPEKIGGERENEAGPAIPKMRFSRSWTAGAPSRPRQPGSGQPGTPGGGRCQTWRRRRGL